jgi:hypothetical protein
VSPKIAKRSARGLNLIIARFEGSNGFKAPGNYLDRIMLDADGRWHYRHRPAHAIEPVPLACHPHLTLPAGLGQRAQLFQHVLV